MRPSLLILTLLFTSFTHAQDLLPTGSAPPALTFDHFPTRMHALVWRNWNLVETDRLAKVLGTSSENVQRVAASMGLPPQRPIPDSFRHRLYISTIRRNWHLLPYDQLLTLLDWTPQQLSEALREDDFLYIKLGSLKPKCEPIRWSEPDEKTTARATQIKSIIEKEFAPRPGLHVEEPLAFLQQFEGAIPDDQVRPSKTAWSSPRFLYSYFAVYGDPLLNQELDPHPDKLLQQYADMGVNGVWLHVVLRDLAPSSAFPEFGKDSDKRLENLARLVARAKRFGIGVYLYLNEPRAMPPEWFKSAGREQVAGITEGGLTTLCTSTPAVREWISGAVTHVFTKVPGLAGVFTITASENRTNCASHRKHTACPRCKNRKAAEIIAEVNTLIEQAVHSASPQANVIAWDWGWPDDIVPDIIAGLPKQIFLQSVSEWSLPLNRGGVPVNVGEYSISAVGPGPRATKHWNLARARGLRTIAKVAANNTWELSSVPWLPARDLVARHAANLSKARVDGLMLSWSLGGYPSVNQELFTRVVAAEDPEKVLNDIAQRIHGPGAAPRVRQAWTLFSTAFEQFPYNGATLYRAPQQVGPANLLSATPTKYISTMVGFPYDDLDRWRGPYPADKFIIQFEMLSQRWQSGLALLSAAVADAPPDRQPAAWRELALAQAALLHFESVAAQSTYINARNQLAKTPGENATVLLQLMQRQLNDETRRAIDLYHLQRADSRIGYEASNHYYYLPQDLQEKVLNCRWLLDQPH